MRVINTHTGHFEEIDPEIIPYAILSHTWDRDGEQTYEQLKKIQERHRPGSQNPYSHGPHAAEREDVTSPNLVQAIPGALGRLTESEVEALLRLVAETFGLAIPAPHPSPDDPSMPLPDSQLDPSPYPTIWDDPELSPKIREACRVARDNDYRYIWIDSCCIDKSSSSELSEAINSMCKWYGLANVCYAHLADVSSGDNHYSEDSAFRTSRWFRRGWTLQELIAPISVEFLSQEWATIGSKQDLVNLVESITKINDTALLHVEPLEAFSVAQRLSWAAERETTRVEDRAYSLLGIFDINMPTLYGEGDRAFRRLQEQIMQRIPDHSLFAWGDIYLPEAQNYQKSISTHCSVHLTAETWPISPLGKSPTEFQDLGNIHYVQPPTSYRYEIVYTLTSYGIRAQFHMIPLTRDLLMQALRHSEDFQLQLSETPRGSQWYLAILQCEHSKYPGHLLGWLCYVSPSESGVGLLHTGYIKGISSHGQDHQYRHKWPSIFPLSSQIIDEYSAQTKLKTVYILHPNRTTNQPESSSLRSQPYTAIKLVLLRETRNALRSRGYSADLRYPDPDHPTTHWLVLSNDEHTITVQFQHSLELDGRCFTIGADVNMSGSRVQLNSALDSEPRADRHTVSWSDWKTREWRIKFGYKRVELSAAGARTVAVDLGLDFAGHGYYFLHVDVLSEDSHSSSAVELPGDQEREGERKDAEDLLSGTSGIQEDIGQEEEMGDEMVSIEVRDAEDTSEDTMTESRDDRGVWTYA